MKKAILLIVTNIILFSCGSRKKDTYESNVKTNFESTSDKKENTYLVNEVNSITDLRNFILDNNLKIKSTGQNYELRYKDLIFSGSADLEFTDKKEETIIHHVYQVHTTYKTETRYQTNTNYQTQKRFKNVSISRKGISFGSVVWMIITALIIGAITGQLIRLYLKRK